MPSTTDRFSRKREREIKRINQTEKVERAQMNESARVHGRNVNWVDRFEWIHQQTSSTNLKLIWHSLSFEIVVYKYEKREKNQTFECLNE